VVVIKDQTMPQICCYTTLRIIRHIFDSQRPMVWFFYRHSDLRLARVHSK